jgi:hypothetical protein
MAQAAMFKKRRHRSGEIIAVFIDGIGHTQRRVPDVLDLLQIELQASRFEDSDAVAVAGDNPRNGGHDAPPVRPCSGEDIQALCAKFT